MIRKLLYKYYLWKVKRAMFKKMKREVKFLFSSVLDSMCAVELEQDRVLKRAKRILEGETK